MCVLVSYDACHVIIVAVVPYREWGCRVERVIVCLGLNEVLLA
jgi:hypothetical protein